MNFIQTKIGISTNMVSGTRMGKWKFLQMPRMNITSISGIAHYEDAIHKVSIPVRTLAGFLDSHHMNKINLLKMDCEGAEYEILMALPESYFAKIEKIAMETHITQAYKTEDMAEFLLSKGYQVKYVTRQKTRTGHVWAWK